jgi:hypothetical protein
MRAAVILIAVSCVSSCARPDYAERWPSWLMVSAGPRPGYGIKRVVEKQPPVTLLGDDGSVCRTLADRFATTAVGAWIACEWALPSLDSTEIAQRGDSLPAVEVEVRDRLSSAGANCLLHRPPRACTLGCLSSIVSR